MLSIVFFFLFWAHPCGSGHPLVSFFCFLRLLKFIGVSKKKDTATVLCARSIFNPISAFLLHSLLKLKPFSTTNAKSLFGCYTNYIEKYIILLFISFPLLVGVSPTYILYLFHLYLSERPSSQQSLFPIFPVLIICCINS